jgi:hypothetical protein
VAEPPVAGDRLAGPRHAAVDEQQAPQVLHERRLAVHEHVHPAGRELELRDGAHQGLAGPPVAAVQPPEVDVAR